jgi:cytochrome P450
METIRSEILPAVSGETVNDKYLTEKCPHLESLFSEVLRLTTLSPLVRDVMETDTIGGKTLRGGNKIMVWLAHRDPR